MSLDADSYQLCYIHYDKKHIYLLMFLVSWCVYSPLLQNFCFIINYAAMQQRIIGITFLGHYGQFKGRLSPTFSKNAVLRITQYRAHQDMTRRGELARRFMIGKLSNQRTMLQRYHRRQAESKMGQAIEQMGTLLSQLAILPLAQTSGTRRLAGGDNHIAGTPLETILGMEGAGSAAYFRCFGTLLTNREQWPFEGRVKRPPTDAVNALLSFGYSLLRRDQSSRLWL